MYNSSNDDNILLINFWTERLTLYNRWLKNNRDIAAQEIPNGDWKKWHKWKIWWPRMKIQKELIKEQQQEQKQGKDDEDNVIIPQIPQLEDIQCEFCNENYLETRDEHLRLSITLFVNLSICRFYNLLF